ncbi:AMP-binding protein [Pararhodobacter sp.]|uniref:AMP-binding protein n=1 Tax=Pararhodobacter sp. TaxID=2127056 RepID=UPI002FDCBE5C
MMVHSVVSGARQVPGAAVLDDARRLATRLRAADVGQGDRVVLLMRNDITFVTGTLAATALGAVAVPVNWHFTAREVAYVIDDCDAKALIIHADLLHRLGPQFPPGLLDRRLVIAVDVPEDIAAACHIPPEDCRPPAGSETLSEVIASCSPWDGETPPPSMAMLYTSGTTGNPKGVLRLGPSTPNRQGYNGIFDAGARVLLPTPLYHSAPNRFAVMTFHEKGTLVLMPRFDPEETLRLIERHHITTMFIVPTMFVRLLKLPEAVRVRHDLSSLRHVVCAGAPCPPEVKRAILDWWGPCIYEFYGSTETGAMTWATPADARERPGTVGRALPSARLMILDDAGNPCPPGVPGEIYGHLSTMAEFTYHKCPEGRAAIERNGLITSGDVGYLDADGYLFLSDRKRDMIIVGGVNIYPAQIEAVILECPDVLDVAVFGVPDEDLGEIVCAVIAPEPGRALTEAALRDFLAGKLAKYMQPRRIVLDPDMPRDASGKVYKRKLREKYWTGAGRSI